MAPKPAPEPPTVDDLAYLTELAAPIETISSRMSRTDTFVEDTVRRAATHPNPRPARERIAHQAW